MSDSPDIPPKHVYSLGALSGFLPEEEEDYEQPQPEWSGSWSYRRRVQALAIDLESLFIFSDYAKALRDSRDEEKSVSANQFGKERGLTGKQYGELVSKVERHTRDLLQVTHLLDASRKSVGTARCLQDIRDHAYAEKRDAHIAERQAEILPVGEMWADLGDYFAKLIEAAKFGPSPEQVARHVQRQLKFINGQTQLFQHRNPDPTDWPTDDEPQDFDYDDEWMDDGES